MIPVFLFRRVVFSAALLGISAFAAAPEVRTVPWNPSDLARPHETFASRSVTLKGVSSLQGKQIKATWDFGDGSPAQSFAVERFYDVSATHAYFGTAGTEYTARLTVEDTTTGESASAEYRIALREKSLGMEVSVATDEALWYLHKTMRGDPTQATAWNVLAFERLGHLPSGDISNPYTETVAQALSQLVKLSADPATPPDAAWVEALAVSGSPEARAALASFGGAAAVARRDLGRTGRGDIASRLLALAAEGVGRPDARWVRLESQLRDSNNLDLNTASLFELAQALRTHVSSGKPSPLEFIQTDSVLAQA